MRPGSVAEVALGNGVARVVVVLVLVVSAPPAVRPVAFEAVLAVVEARAAPGLVETGLGSQDSGPQHQPSEFLQRPSSAYSRSPIDPRTPQARCHPSVINGRQPGLGARVEFDQGLSNSLPISVAMSSGCKRFPLGPAKWLSHSEYSLRRCRSRSR